MITLGGDAELELVDTLDPFSEVRQATVKERCKAWSFRAYLIWFSCLYVYLFGATDCCIQGMCFDLGSSLHRDSSSCDVPGCPGTRLAVLYCGS